MSNILSKIEELNEIKYKRYEGLVVAGRESSHNNTTTSVSFCIKGRQDVALDLIAGLSVAFSEQWGITTDEFLDTLETAISYRGEI